MTERYNFRRELQFTSTYQTLIGALPAERELACLKVQMSGSFVAPKIEDHFAGRYDRPLVGFSIDEWGQKAFGYYHLAEVMRATMTSSHYSDEEKRDIEAMIDFWEQENTSAKLRASYSTELKKFLPSDNWMGEPGIAFPLYRLTGGNLNYEQLLQLGIGGLENLIKARIQSGDEHEPAFLEAMLGALQILRDTITAYIGSLSVIRESLVDPERSKRLRIIIKSLKALLTSAPSSFHEAIQLFWLYSLLADNRNYGRMDVYLGDFLHEDLSSGVISEIEAQEMLNSLWKLMADRETRVHGRIIIGGKGRKDEANADHFALLAMEATRVVLAIEPQLSLRIYDGMNQKLLEKAYDVLSEGRTFPILYNDDANIPSVQKAFGFSELEAEQYTPYGCGEYILDHQSFGTPSGVINLLKALEITLHNGFDPVSKRNMGLPLGAANTFTSFEELLSAYKRQVEHHVRLMAQQEAMEYSVAGQAASFLFTSLLYDNCIERGKSIFNDGIRYLGGTLETYGNTNAADSLLAIRQLVFEDKQVSLEELIQALDSDFEGHALLRKQLQDLPKYGNDIEVADRMYDELHHHVCEYVADQAKEVDLHSYLVVIINNSANTLMGRWTSASADGRRSGTSMNNGNAPSSGNDKEGATALLNSLVKPAHSIHAGAVQNMKFSRDTFIHHRAKVVALLDSYFKNGGAQAMITVVDRDELEKAMDNPEAYSHVFVRVGGFSARFIELDHDVQLEILNRTLY
ncbi:MAG: pyruvate formate-lyase [Candidatus Marinimicrobia bacterium]|nr:pyruvate formate-lyase [Candidatus Neomarinimicrobiota bacterium]MCF7850906.1 pyruvate formate-lyase [Candidatus Neomarinimicrobiota bacterium]MCF7905126.1 pyruvate formate-lyase [Candidatus Neomarinimicrobiota bacterium]